MLIGLIGGLVCFFAVYAKQYIKYDDSLDVVGVHGVGGAGKSPILLASRDLRQPASTRHGLCLKTSEMNQHNLVSSL